MWTEKSQREGLEKSARGQMSCLENMQEERQTQEQLETSLQSGIWELFIFIAWLEHLIPFFSSLLFSSPLCHCWPEYSPSYVCVFVCKRARESFQGVVLSLNVLAARQNQSIPLQPQLSQERVLPGSKTDDPRPSPQCLFLYPNSPMSHAFLEGSI